MLTARKIYRSYLARGTPRAMRKSGTAEEWERVRSIAANMIDQGHAPAAIAQALGVAA